MSILGGLSPVIRVDWWQVMLGALVGDRIPITDNREADVDFVSSL